MTATTLLHRLDARDRALYSRFCVGSRASAGIRLAWLTITHLGGAACSIAAAVLPAVMGVEGEWRQASAEALAALVLSHLVVQLIKRTVVRPRPSIGMPGLATIREPDRFSFPSGHSAAAMSVAVAYALAFPALSVPLVAGAFLVGASRVLLGVHYPGDVLIGQLIAVTTVVGVHVLR